MAVVVISNELVSTVKGNIQRYFYNQILNIPKLSVPYPQTRSEVLSLLYGDKWEEFDRIVSGPINPFVMHVSKIRVVPALSKAQSININLLEECSGPIFVPVLPQTNTLQPDSDPHPYHYAIVRCANIEWVFGAQFYKQIEVNPVGRWEPLIRPMIEWQQAQDQIKEKQDATLRAAQKLLESHRTLGPCLRVWPSLWDFLPAATRDRHTRKVDANKHTPTSDNPISSDDRTALQELDVSLAIKKLRGEAQ